MLKTNIIPLITQQISCDRTPLKVKRVKKVVMAKATRILPRSITLGRKWPSPIIYDGKQQQFTVTVYNNCKRCCTVYYDYRKQ
jgi:hypothetical protein